MAQIANRWRGKGLAAGTAITSANVATAGNAVGSAVTWIAGVSSPRPAAFVTEGDGCRLETDATATASIKAVYAAAQAGLRAQVVVTVDSASVSNVSVMLAATSSEANRGHVQIRTDQRPAIYLGADIPASYAPAVAVGDRLLIDVVYALHSSPTTSNGRIFYRVTNLTSGAWNGGAPYFWDSGYALNLGVGDIALVRWGKVSNGSIPGPGWLLEHLGVETVAVNVAHTSKAQAEAYFADAPAPDPVPLATPVVTLGAKTDATSYGASDGTQTVTWAPIPGAASYDAYTAPGGSPTQEAFALAAAGVTSPHVFTGLSAGTRSYGIKARV